MSTYIKEDTSFEWWLIDKTKCILSIPNAPRNFIVLCCCDKSDRGGVRLGGFDGKTPGWSYEYINGSFEVKGPISNYKFEL